MNRPEPNAAPSPDPGPAGGGLAEGAEPGLPDAAFEAKPPPATDKLPNLRYLGVGPQPSQIIKDVPATPELVRLA